jgi:hypothetical protein
MPDIVSLTFRDQVTGKINDLLIDEDKACADTQNLIAYLAGSLFDYRDEGTEFLPSILVCDSIQRALQSFPGAVTHQIGAAELDPASGRKVLKDCAPLSNKNWFVFIERAANKIRYGVFTYFRLPTAISLHEGIAIGGVFAILIRKISRSTVEVRGAKGSILSLIFSTIRESNEDSGSIADFAANCFSAVPAEPALKDFQIYFTRLLEGEVSSSHGTILACGQGLKLADVQGMSDAVDVHPVLDFYRVFSDYHSVSSAESILALQRCEELFRGFLRCDGIIVFDTLARITAYRLFYHPAVEAGAEGKKVIGGARRRAFESIKDLVGKDLISVLFRSQDGLTIYHGGSS